MRGAVIKGVKTGYDLVQVHTHVFQFGLHVCFRCAKTTEFEVQEVCASEATFFFVLILLLTLHK